jgi:4-diphosphocytidyl-2-C-methyl-D-erythritol kinase
MPESESFVALLEVGNATPAAIAGKLANNLAPAAETLLPEIKTLTDELSATEGVYRAMLTGSGSTVFGICENTQTAVKVARKFAIKGHWVKACMA